MRNATRFTKIVLAAALGGMAVSACGTADATGKAQAKVSAVDTTATATATAKSKPTATPERMVPPDALAEHPDPAVRSMALEIRITNTCEPGTMPELPALPSTDDLAEPAPEEQPTRSAPPAPLPGDATEPPSSEPAVETVLSPLGACVGHAHVDRILNAFDGAGPADYAELRKALIALDYLPEAIHRMPDHGGRPRVRLDLRSTGVIDNLVVEVVSTADTVLAEPFGAPVTQSVDVTEVKRKPNGS
ncbi:hypothetical protein ACFQ9H_20155 [Streptomyces sp. NPDC056517]|uniref:hypothetical protein n=1 Tax=Streptomyces sp. NPDC056517 TaxID=3345848 RepID=UPI00369C2CC1